jgi:hypothetical protein
MKLKDMQLMFENELLSDKGKNAYIYLLKINKDLDFEVDIDEHIKFIWR